MTTSPTEHNHPPRCCCRPDDMGRGVIICPACPEHGVKPDPIECPQCHTPIGRPHTEYCTLGPDKVWDGVLPETGTCRVCGCTDDEACDLGCWWVEPNLCSNCQL